MLEAIYFTFVLRHRWHILIPPNFFRSNENKTFAVYCFSFFLFFEIRCLLIRPSFSSSVSLLSLISGFRYLSYGFVIGPSLIWGIFNLLNTFMLYPTSTIWWSELTLRDRVTLTVTLSHAVGEHVPFLVLGDAAWVCPDCLNNRTSQHHS